jgi:hypothetical protein
VVAESFFGLLKAEIGTAALVSCFAAAAVRSLGGPEATTAWL